MGHWLISIFVHSAPHWFLWLLLNLFLLEHLLIGLNLIRGIIGSLPIFAKSGTTGLHCGTAVVRHCRCLCRLIYTNSFLPLKLDTFIAIYDLSSICLGSCSVPKPMLDWGVSPLLELRHFWIICLLVTYLSLTTQAALANDVIESSNFFSHCLHICKVSGISI